MRIRPYWVRAFALVAMIGIAPLSQVSAQGVERDEASEEEARALFTAGRVAYDGARYDEALDRFKAAYALSGRAELLFNIGQAADRLRRDKEALAAFEEFLAKAPKNASGRRAASERVKFLRQQLGEAAMQDASDGESHDANAVNQSETGASGEDQVTEQAGLNEPGEASGEVVASTAPPVPVAPGSVNPSPALIGALIATSSAVVGGLLGTLGAFTGYGGLSAWYVTGASLMVVATPVAALVAGGTLAHRAVRGLLGFRIIGWSLYGTGVLGAIVTVAVPPFEPTAYLLTTGLLALGLGAFAIDDFAAHSEARKIVEPTAQAWILPTISFTQDTKGRLLPTASLVGSF